MAYATYTDVQAYLPTNSFTIAVDSNPSISTVTGWILGFEGDINAALEGCGYETVPVTGTNDVERLKGRVARKVAAMSWDAHYSKQGAAIPAWVTRYHDEFKDFTEKLEDCKFVLQDQTPADSGSFHVGYVTLYSETYSDTET